MAEVQKSDLELLANMGPHRELPASLIWNLLEWGPLPLRLGRATGYTKQERAVIVSQF